MEQFGKKIIKEIRKKKIEALVERKINIIKNDKIQSKVYRKLSSLFPAAIRTGVLGSGKSHIQDSN